MGVDEIQVAIDVTRQALWMTILLSLPILVVGLVVGVVISIMQAATQIQEQTLSFVPKILAVILTLFILTPWFISQMMDYTTVLFEEMPRLFIRS